MKRLSGTIWGHYGRLELYLLAGRLWAVAHTHKHDKQHACLRKHWGSGQTPVFSGLTERDLSFRKKWFCQSFFRTWTLDDTRKNRLRVTSGQDAKVQKAVFNFILPNELSAPLKIKLSNDCHVSTIQSSILPPFCIFNTHYFLYFKAAGRGGNSPILRWFLRLNACVQF